MPEQETRQGEFWSEVTGELLKEDLLPSGALALILGLTAGFLVIPLASRYLGEDPSPEWLNNTVMSIVLGIVWSRPYSLFVGRQSFRSTAFSFLCTTSLLLIFTLSVF